MKRLWLWPVLLTLFWSLSPPSAVAEMRLQLEAPVPGALVTPYDGGTSRYSAGHRGVDLRAGPGEEVRAAAVGTVYFAGLVAGTPSVSVDHGNGLRTTYLPVTAAVSVGERVQAGQVIGHLSTTIAHCSGEFCLHWGLTDGTDYFDPMLYLVAPPVRLLPQGTQPPEVAWLPPANTGSSMEPGSLPVAGPITSRFGMRVHPVTGVYKLHDGIDIGAACGVEIRLPWVGTVTSAGYHGGYGYRVVVDHGGTQTAYAHLPGIEVSVGQVLSAGARVGRVGNTGYSTGCHLHWMAWVGGALVDPLTLVG